ncbi:MAG TPA: hypothetical protein VGF14_00015 [Alphaproteobacteria bacterium]
MRSSLLPCLLLGLALSVPAVAAKPVEDAPRTKDALTTILGPVNRNYIAEDALKTNPQAGGSYDYRSVTILPEFERYSSKGRWSGNSATTLLAGLKNFNGTRGSSAMRQLWRHILLSDFKGLDMDGKSENAQQIELFAQRLHLLNQLGFFDEAARLYQKADTDKNPIPEAVAQQGVDSIALAGSADGACLEVNLALGSLRSDSWLQDGALCAAYFGQTGKADALYDEVADRSGSGFRTIYKMLKQKSVSSVAQVNIPPLWRTLLLAKGASVGVNSLNSIAPSDLAAIAVNRHVPFGMRMNAGLRAAQAGTISADQLRKLYDEQGTPNDAELADMRARIKDGEILSRPKMYQAARFTWAGNDRAIIVQKALKSLPNINSTLGEVYHWIIVKLTLQKDAIAWFAPTGYVTLRVGNRGDAKYYYEYGDLSHHYVSFITLFDNNDNANQAFFAKWRKDIKKRFPKDALWRIDTAMAIAHMLGVPENVTDLPVTKGAPTKNTKQKETTPDLPSTVTRKELQPFEQAVANHERGNAVVAALSLFAQSPWRQLQPSFLDYLFTGLKKVGAKGENAKIGLEIAMQTVI